jgi:hypothetical protein
MWRDSVDQPPHIRRLANGAIDFDFYRERARALRRAAIGHLFKRRSGPEVALPLLARLRAIWKT